MVFSRLAGVLSEDSDWKGLLIERSKLSNVKKVEGAPKDMTEREWSRWKEGVRSSLQLMPVRSMLMFASPDRTYADVGLLDYCNLWLLSLVRSSASAAKVSRRSLAHVFLLPTSTS